MAKNGTNLKIVLTGELRQTLDDASDEEKAVEILKKEFPRLCNDIGVLVGKPFTLLWDPTEKFGATDCRAAIHLSPASFIEGRRRIGYGVAYHESGHIRHSPYGSKILKRAADEGGETLVLLLNLLLDRKDDILTAEDAPGFADDLRRRLQYVCTESKRHLYSQLLTKYQITDEDAIRDFLSRIPPKDLYEDFFYACKWSRRPRFRQTFRAMKYCTRRRLLKLPPEGLLWTAKRVREILGEPPEKQGADGTENRFIEICLVASALGAGASSGQINPALLKAIRIAMARYVSGLRAKTLKSLGEYLKSKGIIFPGPLSVGFATTVPVIKVPPKSDNAALYREILQSVSHLSNSMLQALRRLNSPSEYELSGQDEGDLDLSEVARIATGLSGYRKELVIDRDIDACLHLCIDMSGSMGGEKVNIAKQLVALFSEAINCLHGKVEGRVWGYDSTAIVDYGLPTATSGFVNAEGSHGNSDSQMIPVVAGELAKSRKKQKLMLVFCDDGPDDIETVRQLTHQLKSRGVLAIHFVIGAHGTPQIYPFEILYNSAEETVQEFGIIMQTILGNLR
ncbi:VWA domain-containing protein [Candidatus Falkowbacteria bacterium]|nr:VWA domain-containing protein [Candidatus Falkowbacteria bacterium]